jgi:SAM-dependent methyltransferase
VLIVSSVAQAILTAEPWPLITVVAVLACMGLALYVSRRGKFVVWSRVLDRALSGSERVLDLGCGRGAVLLLAARRVPGGEAVGVDLWRKRDQSGNAEAQTRRNAVAEGVSDRVELVTADFSSLPLPDAGFDVIVSSVAIHNVHGRAARAQVLAEAVRVLRPGGRLLLADFWLAARGYEAELRAAGLQDVASRGLGWRLWWSGPWLATSLVTATKPAS